MPPVRHPLIRRNGLLQACENCRKAKIRCEHQSPMCSRCERRGLTCNYHPAPLTRIRGPIVAAVSSGILTPKESPVTEPIQATTDKWPLNELPSHSSREPPNTSILHDLESDPRSRYFSAIFSEHRSSFVKNIMDVVQDDESLQTSTAGAFASSELRDGHPEVQLQRGIKILQEFPTLRTCEILLQSQAQISNGWLSPIMIETCLAQVWRDYGQQLKQPRTASSLLEIVTDLCKNDRHPISMDSTTDWKNWFGGSRIRWEMLSILFSFFGSVFKQLEGWDSTFSLPEQKGMNPKTAAGNMAECAQLCLDMHDEAQINDLVVCAIKNIWTLRSNILSDNSDILLRGNGIVFATVITASLHRTPQSATVTPLSEYRLSLASSIYYLDKRSSLFTGRPPLLTKQYCHCPLPLDLSEDDLYGGPETLASAVSKLDQRGWNTNGMIYNTTWLRSRCLLTRITENILEMSIGFNTECTEERINNLMVEIETVVASYPPQLQYHNLQHWSHSLARGRSGRELYAVARVQLDVLQCRFLLQRLHVSRCNDSGQKLLKIAQEMMAVVLSLWLHRDHLQNFNFALNWIAVAYGIPCAGILCLELRRATIAVPGSPPPLRFLKSEVIESLTIYVAFLGWIRPTDGNAELCWKLRNVIKRIVDNVLDSPTVSEPSGTAEVLDSLDMGNWDDLDWLNTIDWTQGDWLETNESLT